MTQPRPTGSGRRLCGFLSTAVWVAFLLWASAAPASESPQYDPKEAGHPLRLAAYLLHPIGVAVDYCLMRPAYWMVQHEPLATIFGVEREPGAREKQAARQEP